MKRSEKWDNYENKPDKIRKIASYVLVATITFAVFYFASIVLEFTNKCPTGGCLP